LINDHLEKQKRMILEHLRLAAEKKKACEEEWETSSTESK